MSELQESVKYRDLPEWMRAAAYDLSPEGRSKHRIITVDGAPSSGKTSLSAMIAERFDIGKLTTGMLYCARGLAIRKSGASSLSAESAIEAAINAKIDFDLTNPWNPLLSINGEDVSDVLFDQANKYAATAISDNREIVESNNRIYSSLASANDMVLDRGSTSFQYPDLKIWLSADPMLRAHRRREQLIGEGKVESVGKIRAEHKRREERDAYTKLYAPSIDSLFIDTTEMSLEQVFAEVEYRIDGVLSTA